MWLAWLRFWRRRRSRTSGRLVLYTRHGCHLCEDIEPLLREAGQRHGFQLQRLDVDGDPALADRFGTKVPVVEVNGKVRFWGRINPRLLERCLRAEGRRSI